MLHPIRVGNSKAAFLCETFVSRRRSSYQTFPASFNRSICLHTRRLKPVRASLGTCTVQAGLHVPSVLVTASLIVLGSLFGYKLLLKSDHTISPQNDSVQQLSVSPIEKQEVRKEILARDSMGIAPGRPGNLTPEQEAKLREFWVVVLRVFGVFPDQASAEGDGTDTPSGAGSGTDAPDGDDGNDPAGPAGVEKKRKKRLGLFSKKSHKEREQTQPTSGGTSNPPLASIGESEDKYGQAKQFKQALSSQSPEDLRTAFWSMVKHDNPDGLLLRFLRARKWDVEKALVMLVSTMHWRAQEMHVDDDVIKVGEAGALEASKSGDTAAKKEAEDFLAQLRIGKSYLHGLDKEGRPMCFVRVRLHKQGEQSETSLERYTVYVIETARLLLTGPVDTAVR